MPEMHSLKELHKFELSGLEEQNGRLQALVGELLRKNQELRFAVTHTLREHQDAGIEQFVRA